VSHTPLPLAAANERRKGKPGRPRKPLQSENPPDLRLQDRATVARLLDLQATATYLGLSGWSVRDLEAAGILRRVLIPRATGGEVRKLLFDRVDLDALIEQWKQEPR
jgi:hypothetical protein